MTMSSLDPTVSLQDPLLIQSSIFLDMQAVCNRGRLIDCFRTRFHLPSPPRTLTLRLDRGTSNASVEIEEVIFDDRLPLPQPYALIAAAIHHHGHYWSLVRNPSTGCWFRCDDAHCIIIGAAQLLDDPMMRRHATMLIYRQVDLIVGETDVRLPKELVKEQLRRMRRFQGRSLFKDVRKQRKSQQRKTIRKRRI